jgi:hypothetical protein
MNLSNSGDTMQSWHFGSREEKEKENTVPKKPLEIRMEEKQERNLHIQKSVSDIWIYRLACYYISFIHKIEEMNR